MWLRAPHQGRGPGRGGPGRLLRLPGPLLSNQATLGKPGIQEGAQCAGRIRGLVCYRHGLILRGQGPRLYIQPTVARKLGVGQGVVSRLEHRDDMLLSTLYDYLMATGAEGASIVVVVNGHRIELDLGRLRSQPEQQSA